jgi:hypothetical protein
MELPMRVLNELYAWACELRRPSYMLKPRIFIDGDKWCALYGDNLQEGVTGFGDSPEKAYWDFDKSWYAEIIRDVNLKDEVEKTLQSIKNIKGE